MPSFPSLAKTPDRNNFKEGYVEGNTIRDEGEVYNATRPRSTRVRKKFLFRYTLLTQADKDTLENFITNTVFLEAISFTWTHPQSAVVYTVRFRGEPEFIYRGVNYWDVDNITLEQV
jgi:hypothetical protein